MFKYSIPYGNRSIDFSLNKEAQLLVPETIVSTDDEDAIVLNAMANPIDSPSLCELAKDKHNCVIIISDHTRPVPSKKIIPHMLKELRLGNPDIDITLLVATGFHRLTDKTELINKLGEDIVNSEKIIVHNASDPESNEYIGDLPSGGKLVIDKTAINTELLIAEGFIEPHFFAGFSGGRKSVLPGICDKVTVLANHCGMFIADEHSRTGILQDNPIHRDMIAACQMANLKYIVNVVIDEDKKVAAAFAGDPINAHLMGCNNVKSIFSVKAKSSDIIITGNGGAPLDQNIYQTVKCMTAAEAAARDNSVIIVCSECADGTGGDSFYNALKNCSSMKDLLAEAERTPADKTIPDQWQYQVLARVMQKCSIIFVTEEKNRHFIEDMKMKYAPSIESALAEAYSIMGNDASITVIPNGISVIVESI